MTDKKLNYIYKNADGEYFLSVEKNGELLLSNHSYPFLFLFEVQEPLEEIGEAKKYGHLVTKQDYEFHEGESLTVEVSDGQLKVKP